MKIKTISEFTYRGMACTVKRLSWATPVATLGVSETWVNGYMRGPIRMCSYQEVEEAMYLSGLGSAHKGFTYSDVHNDGTVTLGFDTQHYDDGPDTQNEAFVTEAIKRAVDDLHTAGLVATT